MEFEKKIPRRRNVTTSVVEIKKGSYTKISPKNGEPQGYSLGMQKEKKKKTKNSIKGMSCLLKVKQKSVLEKNHRILGVRLLEVRVHCKA